MIRVLKWLIGLAVVVLVGAIVLNAILPHLSGVDRATIVECPEGRETLSCLAEVSWQDTPIWLLVTAVATALAGVLFGPRLKIAAFIAITLLFFFVAYAYSVGLFERGHTLAATYIITISVAGLTYKALEGARWTTIGTATILISVIFGMLGLSHKEFRDWIISGRTTAISTITECTGVPIPVIVGWARTPLPRKLECEVRMEPEGGCVILFNRSDEKLGRLCPDEDAGFVGVVYSARSEDGRARVMYITNCPRGSPGFNLDCS